MREVFEDDNQAICKELEITPTNAWVMLYQAHLSQVLESESAASRRKS